MIIGLFYGVFFLGLAILALGLVFGSVPIFLAASIAFLFYSIIASNLLTAIADGLAARRNSLGTP